MCSVGYSWEENLIAFYILSEDSDYLDVQFDWISGGLSAIHKEHNFDKRIGPFCCKRGDYERHVVDVLRTKGHRVILLSEYSSNYDGKKFDCLLDGKSGDIKTVESDGHWAVRTKMYYTAKQRASYIILYFPDRRLFSYERVIEGWRMFLSDPIALANDLADVIKRTYIIVDQSVLEIEKPPG